MRCYSSFLKSFFRNCFCSHSFGVSQNSLRGCGWLREEGRRQDPASPLHLQKSSSVYIFYILGFPKNFHSDGTQAPMRTQSEWAALFDFIKPSPALPPASQRWYLTAFLFLLLEPASLVIFALDLTLPLSPAPRSTTTAKVYQTPSTWQALGSMFLHQLLHECSQHSYELASIPVPILQRRERGFMCPPSNDP